MNSNSEENLLDESLRDVFHDYSLPPAEHMRVWAGVEERIAALPAARKGVAYRLVLPLTAALGVGMAVGWLLPRPIAPAAPPAVPAARPAAWAPARLPVVAPPAAPGLAASALPMRPGKAVPAPGALAAGTAPHRIVALSKPEKQQPSAPVAAGSQPLVAGTAPLLVSAAEADSAAQVTDLPIALAATPVTPGPGTAAAAVAEETSATAIVPDTMAAAAATTPHPVAAHATKPLKPAGANEKMLYHKPTHRQPERGPGLRRWFSHLTQSIRHLL